MIAKQTNQIIIEIRIDRQDREYWTKLCVGQPNILVILLLGTLSYLIQISQSFVLMAFVAYETQGLAGHFRTLINQLLSWFYFLVSKMENKNSIESLTFNKYKGFLVLT